MVAPGDTGVDKTRLQDFDRDRLQAQHNDLVQPERLLSVLEFGAHTPRRPSIICTRPRPAPLLQRDPGIDQPMLVGERIVFGVDGVEVACDDMTPRWRFCLAKLA